MDYEFLYIKSEDGAVSRYLVEAGKDGPLKLGISATEEEWKGYLQSRLDEAENQDAANKVYNKIIPEDVRAKFTLPTGLPEANSIQNARSAMAAKFEKLDINIRAKFATVEMTVNRRLDQGDIDGAKQYLEGVRVPPEIAPLKAQFISDLDKLAELNA